MWFHCVEKVSSKSRIVSFLQIASINQTFIAVEVINLRATIIIGNQKIDIVFYISTVQNCLEHIEIKRLHFKVF